MSLVQIRRGTKESFNNLQEKNLDTIYFITDTGEIFLGSTNMTGVSQLGDLAFLSEIGESNLSQDLKTKINNKVDKEEGKSLIADSEIERLASVDNYDDTAVRELIQGNTDAIATEKSRAEGIEGGLRTDVDAVTARVNTFLDGTGAAEDVIDTLQDLINYINTHDDVEISGILTSIQALEDKLAGVDTTVVAYVEAVKTALEQKITAAEGGYAAADAALKSELQAEIDADVKALKDGEVAQNTATISQNTADILTKANASDVYTKSEVYTKAETESLVTWGSF